jgi:hypothetical protein
MALALDLRSAMCKKGCCWYEATAGEGELPTIDDVKNSGELVVELEERLEGILRLIPAAAGDIMDDVDWEFFARKFSVALEVRAIASKSFSSRKQLPETPDFGWALRHRFAPVSELAQHNAGRRCPDLKLATKEKISENYIDNNLTKFLGKKINDI